METTMEETPAPSTVLRNKASEAAKKRWQQRKEKERLKKQIELDDSK